MIVTKYFYASKLLFWVGTRQPRYLSKGTLKLFIPNLAIRQDQNLARKVLLLLQVAEMEIVQ